LELFRPLRPLVTNRIFGETIKTRMDDMQLGFEAGSMNHPSSLRILTLEENLILRRRARTIAFFIRRSDAHRIAQEVADISSKAQQSFVSCVFCLLNIL